MPRYYTLAPSLPNPLKLSTPVHFSISLPSAEYIVFAFPSVISISIMKDILFSPSFIYFTAMDKCFLLFLKCNRGIYFLFSMKLWNFRGKNPPLKWRFERVFEQKIRISGIWESQSAEFVFYYIAKKMEYVIKRTVLYFIF